MRKQALLIVAVVSLLVGFAPAPFPKTPRHEDRSDLDQLQGVWAQTGRMDGGTATSVGKVWIVVTGNHMAYFNQGKVVSEWTFTLDPRSSPKRIDAREIGPPKRAFPGIYVLENSTLKMAYRGGQPSGRPSTFTGKGPNDLVEVFSRKKP
jgi:uncharacterized protein (TIGR03067 family)